MLCSHAIAFASDLLKLKCVTRSAEEVAELLRTATASTSELHSESKGSAAQCDDTLLRAMQSMESKLQSSSIEAQVDLLFAALKRASKQFASEHAARWGLDDKTSGSQVHCLLRMWQPCLGAAEDAIKAVAEECRQGSCFELFERCTAGAAETPRVMREVAKQCEMSMGTGCMPLYVVSKSSQCSTCENNLRRIC